MTALHFQINGLTGDGAAARLTHALSSLSCVAAADVSAARGSVTIIGRDGYDCDAGHVQALRVVTSAGYEIASGFDPRKADANRRWFRHR